MGIWDDESESLIHVYADFVFYLTSKIVFDQKYVLLCCYATFTFITFRFCIETHRHRSQWLVVQI
jgi:hypothetical protein